MRRIVTAALLAAPLLVVGAGTAAANPGPCTYGFGCGGWCINLFPRMHQVGPLYNYGPYYGYPPFAPYGPWNPYLQYTGPVNSYGYGGGCAGCGGKLKSGNPHPLCGGLFGGACGGCSGLHGVMGGGLGAGWPRGGHHGCSSCGHAGKGHSCGSVAAGYVTSGNAYARYTGYGDPTASAAYYVGAPGLTDPAAVAPAGYLAP